MAGQTGHTNCRRSAVLCSAGFAGATRLHGAGRHCVLQSVMLGSAGSGFVLDAKALVLPEAVVVF